MSKNTQATNPSKNETDTPAEVAGLSLKNKKAELLDALNAALRREQELKTAKYDPIEEVKTRQNQQKVQATRENVAAGIFSAELNKKFQDLEDAIVIEEEKLRELYGIEEKISDLTAAINASQTVLSEFEAKKQQQMQELEQKITALETDYAEKSRQLKLERERETEEYNYNLKRQRTIDDDKWQAEKTKREQELAEKELRTMELLSEAEEKSAHVQSLEQQIAELPEQLTAEYTRGRDDATKELNHEHKFNVELMKKDYQNKLDRQADKVTSLTDELKKVSTEKDAALDKLDKAYAQIKEMATKTVEASGGVRILGGEQLSS